MSGRDQERWDDAAMDIARDDHAVSLRMTSDEAQLTFVRAESRVRDGFTPRDWTRHGVAQPSAHAVAEAIYDVATGAQASISAELDPGIEAIENPQRPRPS